MQINAYNMREGAVRDAGRYECQATSKLEI